MRAVIVVVCGLAIGSMPVPGVDDSPKLALTPGGAVAIRAALAEGMARAAPAATVQTASPPEGRY